jgi:hypothetical protein
MLSLSGVLPFFLLGAGEEDSREPTEGGASRLSSFISIIGLGMLALHQHK